MSNTRVSSREIEGAIARGIQRQKNAQTVSKIVVVTVFLVTFALQGGLGYLLGQPLYGLYALLSFCVAGALSVITGAWAYRAMLSD